MSSEIEQDGFEWRKLDYSTVLKNLKENMRDVAKIL